MKMNRSVLFVDDDFRVLQAYGRLLHKIYNMTLARNADEALSIVGQNGPFAVVVADYQMPGMNGVELLSLIRRLAPETIRIMLTGQTDTRVAISAINEGDVFRFLTKPCDNEEMIATINEAIEQYHFITEERTARHEQICKEEKLKTINNSVRSAQEILQQKDSFTAQHQLRVAQLAAAISRMLYLEPDKVNQIEIAAKVHDIGKFFIPNELLNRPGKVSSMELEVLQTHSRNGYEILRLLDFYKPIADCVLQHHERIDGSGYPQGLKGGEILLEARIIGVADVVEAIASPRPYRRSLGIEIAIHEIESKKGIRYDLDVVEACVSLFRKNAFHFNQV